MSIFNKIFDSMNQDLPRFNTLDEGTDYLMGYIGRFSEDLWEKEFYINKRWLEIRDNLTFQEAVLHVFEDDGKYLRILDGDIVTGAWEYTLGGLVIKMGAQHELYEKVFLNEKFFVLKKHGDHSSKGKGPKYFFMATESLSKELSRILKRKAEWNDLLVVMYNVYKSNTNYTAIVVGFFIIIAIMILLSIL